MQAESRVSSPARAHTSARREGWFVALALAVTVVTWALVVLHHVPDANGIAGHDYSYFFPRLLAGSYWFERNGPFEVPWFTPAFGGGVPYYAHPASGYYSVPQFGAFFAGPLAAVRFTAVLFAALGFLGAWLLARRVFQVSAPAAIFAAILFTWCGFHSTRLVVGHLGFHSQALVPLAAYFLLRARADEAPRWRSLLVDGLLAGFVFAYFLQSGNFYGLVPAAIASTGCAALLALRGVSVRVYFARFAVAVVVSALLCLAKLSAALAFLDAFPRTGYPLPGFEGLGRTLFAVAQCLFFSAPESSAELGLVNSTFRLERHEFEFGLSFVPLLLFAASAFTRWRGVKLTRDFSSWALLVSALLVPVAVNTYTPNWNAFLDRVPILGSSSSLVRWFVAYVPLVVVASALSIDRIVASSRARTVLASCAAIVVVGVQIMQPLDYLVNGGYSVERIERAAAKVRSDGLVPPIQHVDVARDSSGRPTAAIDRDDFLVVGTSQILCYEPMFGYRNEWMPILRLRPGTPFDVENGEFDFKNPVSYVFPRANGLVPGGHFRVDQRAELEAFLDYRPFAFKQPMRQTIANWINVVALIGVAAFLGWYATRRVANLASRR